MDIDTIYSFFGGKYKYAEPTNHPNFLLIPVNRIPMDEEGTRDFNAIYNVVKDFQPFVRTASGGLSITRSNLRGMRYDVRATTSLVELTVKDFDGRYYRFQVGYVPKGLDEVKSVSGHHAWVKFVMVLKKFKTDITKYRVSQEEGLKIKETIEKPMIGVTRRNYLGMELNNVHHLDLNASYASGMYAYYPDLRDAISYIYKMSKDNTRKDKKYYKAILTHSYGYMQSQGTHYGYSALSKAGVDYNNNFIKKLSEELVANGREIIAYNTDGIWYRGELYHNDYEGDGLCKWKNDHVNCKIRFKSNGCYEFIENGVYTPVFRGMSSYERIKPRNKWEWGDIFMGECVTYRFDKEEGFIKV